LGLGTTLIGIFLALLTIKGYEEDSSSTVAAKIVHIDVKLQGAAEEIGLNSVISSRHTIVIACNSF